MSKNTKKPNSPPMLPFSQVFITNEAFKDYISQAREAIKECNPKELNLYNAVCANKRTGTPIVRADPELSNLTFFGKLIDEDNLLGMVLYHRYKACKKDSVDLQAENIKENFFDINFLYDITRMGIARALKDHQPLLLNRPHTIKDPEVDDIDLLLQNKKICQRLFDDYAAFIISTVLGEKTGGGKNLKDRFEALWDEHTNNPPADEVIKQWCEDEGKILTPFFLTGIPNCINQFQLLATNGEMDSTAARAAYVGFTREWKSIARNQPRTAPIVAEEREAATTIVKYIQASYPFALVTGEDHCALIKKVVECYPGVTLEKIAEAPYDYFNCELFVLGKKQNPDILFQLTDSQKSLNEALSTQQTDNINIYELYLLMQGGKEQFIQRIKSEEVEKVYNAIITQRVDDAVKQKILLLIEAYIDAKTWVAPEQNFVPAINQQLHQAISLSDSDSQKLKQSYARLNKHKCYIEAVRAVKAGEDFVLPLLRPVPQVENEAVPENKVSPPLSRASSAKEKLGGVLQRVSSGRKSIAAPFSEKQSSRRSVFTRSLRSGSMDAQGSVVSSVPSNVLSEDQEPGPAPVCLPAPAQKKESFYIGISDFQSQYVNLKDVPSRSDNPDANHYEDVAPQASSSPVQKNVKFPEPPPKQEQEGVSYVNFSELPSPPAQIPKQGKPLKLPPPPPLRSSKTPELLVNQGPKSLPPKGWVHVQGGGGSRGPQ